VRGEDVVARLGGDEFLIVAAGLTHGDEAAAVAEKDHCGPRRTLSRSMNVN
jgi:GGDEF domain-containing protein